MFSFIHSLFSSFVFDSIRRTCTNSTPFTIVGIQRNNGHQRNNFIYGRVNCVIAQFSTRVTRRNSLINLNNGYQIVKVKI